MAATVLLILPCCASTHAASCAGPTSVETVSPADLSDGASSVRVGVGQAVDLPSSVNGRAIGDPIVAEGHAVRVCTSPGQRVLAVHPGRSVLTGDYLGRIGPNSPLYTLDINVVKTKK